MALVGCVITTFPLNVVCKEMSLATLMRHYLFQEEWQRGSVVEVKAASLSSVPLHR